MKNAKANNKKSKSKNVNIAHSVITFPAKVLKPVTFFLQGRLKKLEKTKKNIDKEDPFRDSSRLVDNASPDTDAAEQFGHARTSAIKEQLDRRIIQTRKALTRIKIGKYAICEDCGKMIDTDRLVVYPDATFCAECQAMREK